MSTGFRKSHSYEIDITNRGPAATIEEYNQPHSSLLYNTFDPWWLIPYIANTTDRRNLFPCVKTVVAEGKWLSDPSCLDVLGLVISSTTQRVVLHYRLPPSHLLSLNQIELILQKTPGLKYLTMNGPWYVSFPLDALGRTPSILKSFQSLISFKTSINWITDPVFDAIKQLKSLRLLSVHTSDPAYNPTNWVIGTHREAWKSRLIPSSIAELAFASHSSVLQCLLQGKPALENLKCLRLDIWGVPILPKFSIGNILPALQELHIGALESKREYWRLSLSDILCFAGECSGLLTLSAVCTEITNTDLIQLVSSWPQVRTLSLRRHPPWETDESNNEVFQRDVESPFRPLGRLTLEALGILASGLPLLENLEISVFASDTSSLSNQLPQGRFERLKTLKFVSSFSNLYVDTFAPSQAANYIRSLVRPGEISINMESLRRYWFILDPGNPDSRLSLEKTPTLSALTYLKLVKEFRAAFRAKL
jgi:hypothetical protein